MKMDGVKVAGMKITDKERDKRAEMTRAPKPRLASTLVLAHGTGDQTRILMGCRSPRHDFMPSVYVFPGGRVDRADSYARYHGDLDPRTERILESAYAPRRARAIVLASVRETWEESGIFLGAPSHETRNLNHPSYDAFRAAGLSPSLDGIEVFGRAVTPPHRHKRFDAWFFLKRMTGELPAPQDSAELQNVGWFTFEEIQALETQRATEMMLRILKQYLARDTPRGDIFHSKAVRGEYKMTAFPSGTPWED